MTPDLEARRARAINRAITRAVQHPHDGGFALVEWLRTERPEVFDTALADIRVVRQRVSANAVRDAEELVDYWVDGVRNSSPRDAAALLQDRYGITQAEAEELLSAADPAGRTGPRHLGSV